MLPLPACEVSFPATVDEALGLLARPGARIVAGGTDLLPNLKRGVGRPTALVSLARLRGLDRIEIVEGEVLELRVGARVTLAALARATDVPRALAFAASLIASPQIRNVATVGGNLCLDTRCVYVNQTELWREALGHCIKAEGTECHVVPGGKRCVAAASADLPPILLALGASVEVVSPRGLRTVALERLYSPDGAHPIGLSPDELVTQVIVPEPARFRSAYRKLRARQAIDFPLLGLAVAARFEGAVVRELRVVANCIGAAPRRVGGLEAVAVGRALEPSVMDAIGDRCFASLHPQDNLAADKGWRRAMVPVLVREALEELGQGGDDGTT